MRSLAGNRHHLLQGSVEPSMGFGKASNIIKKGADPDYVLELEKNSDSTKIACSLSTQDICIYDTTTFGEVSSIQAHSDRINGIEFAKYNESLLLSTSDDNSVKLWDIRVPRYNQPVFKERVEDEILDASLGSSDNLLACACGMGILYYDLRQISTSVRESSTKLGEYTDVHTDTISQVKFHPERPMELLTASEDGLMCIFNTQVSEGEGAIISILNAECPVRRVGYFGHNFDGLYCLSTVETVSVWHSSAAQRIANFPNIRTDLDLEYLVDCAYDRSTDSLQLIAGDHSGNGHMVSISPSEVKKVSSFDNGHASTIRCAVGMNNSNQFITGGEDGKLCMWNGIESKPSARAGATAGATPAARPKSSKNKKNKLFTHASNSNPF